MSRRRGQTRCRLKVSSFGDDHGRQSVAADVEHIHQFLTRAGNRVMLVLDEAHKIKNSAGGVWHRGILHNLQPRYSWRLWSILAPTILSRARCSGGNNHLLAFISSGVRSSRVLLLLPLLGGARWRPVDHRRHNLAPRLTPAILRRARKRPSERCEAES